jgi:hypothetical protein
MPRFLFLSLCALLLAGCGATTVRVDMAPTVDSDGHAGFESTFSIGIGTPVDFNGRSHHYIQTLGSIGGGLDGATSSGSFVSTLSLDYIYWAEPIMDIRTGLRFAYRSTPGVDDSPLLYGFGGQIGVLPIVVGADGSWLPVHICLGPELRLEHMWSNPDGHDRSLFSLPLVAEINFLAAGD